MKRKLFLPRAGTCLILILSLVMILSACEPTGDTVAPEKKPVVSEEDLAAIVADMDGAAATVGSLSLRVTFVRDKNIGEESNHQDQWLEEHIIYGPDRTIAAKESRVPIGATVKVRLDVGGQSYLINEDRSTWATTDPVALEDRYGYFPLYEDFKAIAPKMSLEESETVYTFTFEGEDADIYQRLADPYQLRIEGAPDEAVPLKLTYIIDKGTKTLVEVRYISELTAEEDTVRLETAIQYTAVNPALDLQSPEPVFQIRG